MRDGAGAAREVASYFFDDEGVLAHDTLIIDHGILKHRRLKQSYLPLYHCLLQNKYLSYEVEMDMFVKDRAQAKQFVGKQVASSLICMRDGAGAAREVASYFFDVCLRAVFYKHIHLHSMPKRFVNNHSSYSWLTYTIVF